MVSKRFSTHSSSIQLRFNVSTKLKLKGGANCFNIAVEQNRTDLEANVEDAFPGLKVYFWTRSVFTSSNVSTFIVIKTGPKISSL